MKKLIILLVILPLLVLIACGSNRTKVQESDENISDDYEMVSVAEEEITESVSMPKEVHMAVDLGLPSGIKWAATNLGASNPWDFGDYYSMGEITPLIEYDSSYKYNVEKIPVDERTAITGNPKFDAATANWGENWRMPTNNDLFELYKECEWKWINSGGNNGFKVIGPNGNSIFLPAGGMKVLKYKSVTPQHLERQTIIENQNSNGFYWAGPASPILKYRDGLGNVAGHSDYDYLDFSQNFKTTETTKSFSLGMLIRPVTCASFEELGIDKTQTTDFFEESDYNTAKASGVIASHEYVDLGLPSGIKWATKNVGAKTILDLGEVYQWGATKPGEYYGSTDGSTLGMDDICKNISGKENYDVARKMWGSTWRLPTKTEMEELIENCVWTVTNEGSLWYFIVTGPNKKTIVIPIGENSPTDVGALWSSEPSSRTEAWGMRLRGGRHKNMRSGIISEGKQSLQLNVRPVSN
ncbi:MAG: DUF1566 domain-containing protein [Muribaculaceae bacterium]|nr:DUF1566 domain-containing protein [Muribaculaceae bacterium]